MAPAFQCGPKTKTGSGNPEPNQTKHIHLRPSFLPAHAVGLPNPVLSYAGRGGGAAAPAVAAAPARAGSHEQLRAELRGPDGALPVRLLRRLQDIARLLRPGGRHRVGRRPGARAGPAPAQRHGARARRRAAPGLLPPARGRSPGALLLGDLRAQRVERARRELVQRHSAGRHQLQHPAGELPRQLVALRRARRGFHPLRPSAVAASQLRPPFLEQNGHDGARQGVQRAGVRGELLPVAGAGAFPGRAGPGVVGARAVPLLSPRELHGGRHADREAGVPLRLPRGARGRRLRRRRRLPESSQVWYFKIPIRRMWQDCPNRPSRGRSLFWRHGDVRDVRGVPPSEAAVGVHAHEAEHEASPVGSLLRGALLLVPRDGARHQRLLRGPAPGHGRVRHGVRRPAQRRPARGREAHQAARQRRAGPRHERGEAGVLRQPPQPGPPPGLLHRAGAADPGVRVHAQRHAGGAPAAGARPRRDAVDRPPPRRRRDGQGHRVPALRGAPAHLPPRHQVQQHPSRPRVQLQGRRLRAVAAGQGVRGLVAHLHGAAGDARVRGPAVPPELPPLRQERRVQLRRRARGDHHCHEGRRLRQGAQRDQPGAARRGQDRQGMRQRHRRPVPGPAQGRVDALVHPQGGRAGVPVPRVPQRDEAVHGRGRRRAGANSAQRLGAVGGRRRVHVHDVVALLLGTLDARRGQQVVRDGQRLEGGALSRSELGDRARCRSSGVASVRAGEVVQRQKLAFLQ